MVTALLLLASVPFAIAGCGQTQADSGRLEHEHPAHYPASFREAVLAIEKRAANPQLEGDATACAELADLIDWLPDLAADTALVKAEWEEAAEATKALEEWRKVSSRANPIAVPDAPLETLRRLSKAAER